MFSKKTIITLGAIVTSTALGLAVTPLFAESDCKGLEEGQCEDKTSCTWVDGYTRKDGAKVSSHCRTKSKSKSKSKKKDKKDSS